MGLRDRFSRWLRGAAPPMQWTPMGSENFGPGIANEPDADTLLREANGPFDAGSTSIANRVSELRLLAKIQRRTRAGTVEEEELDDGALKDLLDKPHPNVPRSMLMYNAAMHIVTTGEALLQKVGNSFNTVELHPMPPGRVDPLVSRGVLIGYLVTDAHGRQERLPADVVIRAWFPNPENFWSAQGYLSPTGIAHDAHKFAMQHLRYHYQHDATPKGVIETDEHAGDFTDTQRERFNHQWDSRYSSRHGSVRAPAVLPRGFHYEQVAMDSREGLRPLLEYFRDEQLMMLKVPRAMLGQVVSGDRSSAEVMQWAFDRYAVTPITNLIAAAMTLQLASDFDDNLIVSFEDFVSEDKEFELKREAHDIEHALRTPNKVLTDRNDDEVEWGDQPLIAGTLGPYDPEAALEAMKAPPPVPGAPGDEPEGEPVDDEAERAERREHAAVRAKWKARKRKRAA